VFSYNSLRSLLLFGDFRARFLEDLTQHVCRERLGALKRQAEGTRPDELAHAAESSRNAKENRVVVHLCHAVVCEKDTAVRVHIGPWVLGLALLEKNRWNDLVEIRDELEQRVIGQVLLCKLSLAHVAGIRLTKYRVPIARHDLARLQVIPHVVAEFLLRVILTNLLHTRTGEKL
jgi:hypothetical protein